MTTTTTHTTIARRETGRYGVDCNRCGMVFWAASSHAFAIDIARRHTGKHAVVDRRVAEGTMTVEVATRMRVGWDGVAF